MYCRILFWFANWAGTTGSVLGQPISSSLVILDGWSGSEFQRLLLQQALEEIFNAVVFGGFGVVAE